MKKENKNFIYNMLYQIFIFIVPFISIPYISRILGVENVGIYSYTYSIVYYFMLGTLLGINNYGVREISKLENNKERRNIKFTEIFILQLMLGIVMMIIYNFFVFFVFKNYKNVFYIQNLFLLSAILDINWLYFGLEKFKVTISRNIVIKILSLFLIFIFVKNKDDIYIYTFIMSFSTLLSQIYLWLNLKKYVQFTKIEIHNLKNVLKSCLILFIPVLSYSIYRVMDKTMLGALCGTNVLGLYENAEKIINIPVSIITALGTVMLPSMSKGNSEEEFYEKIYFSFKLCLFIILPIAFGLLVISNDFSVLFFGIEFEESGIIIKLLIPSFIFSSIANVIRTNYLIPKKLDRIYVTSTIVGALINLIVNVTLIPKLGYIGACVGTVCAEFFVMLYQIVKVKSVIDYKKIIKISLRFWTASIICFIVILLLKKCIKNILVRVLLQVFIYMVIYLLINKSFIINEFFNLKGKGEKNAENKVY